MPDAPNRNASHRRLRRTGWVPIAPLGPVLAAGCGGTARSTDAVTPAPTTSWPSPAVAAGGCPRTVTAAGDMNSLSAARATGSLAQSRKPDVVAVLGDQQYPSGSLTDYRSKYGRTGWERSKPRPGQCPATTNTGQPGRRDTSPTSATRPAITPATSAAAGEPYALNSEIDIAGQAQWLRGDLAAHPTARVVANWHRPRYSSGTEQGMQPFWTPSPPAKAQSSTDTNITTNGSP